MELKMTFFKRAVFFLWYFGRFKVPLIGYLRPKLIILNDKDVVIRIPLSRRSKNHLHSMYFGALSVGADLAGGLHGYYYSKKLNLPISLVFKSFEAKFLKRPTSHVYFVGEMGEVVKTMLEESQKTGKRINQIIEIKAFINYPENPEEVAQFKLELSIKII
jgi:hypothetical protein